MALPQAKKRKTGIFYGVFSTSEKDAGRGAKKNFFKKIRGLIAALLFTFSLAAGVVIFAPTELFYAKRKRKKLWRRAGIFLIKCYFSAGGLKIKVEGAKHINKNEPAIYTANHLSNIDGLVLVSLLGANTIPVIAPIKYFSFPVSYWFKKMEYIDVQRSNIEQIKFKSSLKPNQAVEKAIEELRKDHSIVIFPEGHIELQHKLLYFHSGAARIALASVEKVIPVGIIDIDKVIVKKFMFISGTIKIIFGEPIDLVDYYKKNIPTIKETSLKLKKEISELLPKRYLALGYGAPHPEKSAVLMNIDNTLYDGDAQKDLLVFLLSNGLIDIKYLFVISYFYIKKKLGIITSREYFNSLIPMIKGWRVDRVYKYSRLAFNSKLKFNIYEKMRTVIKDHQESGHKIILITNIISPLAKCFADYLEVDCWISLCLEENRLKFTGKLLEKFSEEDKAAQVLRLKKNLKFRLDQSFAYGHDEKDLPMLKLAKYRALVNPKDDLKKYAQKHKIEIIEI